MPPRPPVTVTPAQPFIVAITGGVAAGKSAVSQRFEALGIHVHDADIAAREVVASHTHGLKQIAQIFGAAVILPHGHLDRRALRTKVFADPTARQRLEAIVHPLVDTWLRERLAADSGPYTMAAIPLLAETWPRFAWVNRVLVIDTSDKTRIQRLMARDCIDAKLARRMLQAQAPPQQRLALADEVIANDGAEAALDAQVQRLHQHYLRLASAGSQ